MKISWGGKAQKARKFQRYCAVLIPHMTVERSSRLRAHSASLCVARNLRLNLVLKSVNESSSFYSYQPRNDSKSHEDSVFLIIRRKPCSLWNVTLRLPRSNDLIGFSHKLVWNPVKLAFFFSTEEHPSYCKSHPNTTMKLISSFQLKIGVRIRWSSVSFY